MFIKNFLIILLLTFVNYSSTYYVTKDSSFYTKSNYYSTIKTGLLKLKSGDTLQIKNGVYSEGLLYIGISGTENKPTVISGENGVIIKGSKTLNTTWTNQSSNVWKTTCTDSIQSERIFLCDNNFFTIIPLKMVTDLKLLSSDSMFYYDMKNNTLYIRINTNPNKYKIEIPVSKEVVFINGHDIHMKNMALLFSDSLSYGLIYHTTSYNNVVDSFAIKYMNWGGAFIHGTKNTLMNSDVSYCGCIGATGKGNNHFIYNNFFSYNNTDLYDVDCISAGAKLGPVSNSIIMKNTFCNNYGPGFWIDVECDSNLIIQNTSYNNCIAGMEIEISKSNVIVNNIAYKNRVPVHGNYKVFNDKQDKYKGFQTIDNYYHDYWNRSGNGIWVFTSPYTKLFNNICFANQGAGLRIEGGDRVHNNYSFTTHDIICQKNISINNEGTQLWIKDDAENIRSDYNIFSTGDTIFRTNLSAKNGGRFTSLSEWQNKFKYDLNSVVYNNIEITDSSKGTVSINDNKTGIPVGDTIDLKWAYGNQSASIKLGPKAGSYGVSGTIKTLIGTIRLKSDDNGVFIDSTINPSSPCIYSVVVSGISPLQSGTIHHITWNVDPTVKIDSCIVSASFDSGATWKSVGKTIGKISFFDWAIPRRKSDSAFIKITAYDYKKNSFSAISKKFSTVIISEFVLKLQQHSQKSIIASWNPANITTSKKEAFCLAYKKGSIVTSINEAGIDTLMYDLTASCDTISKGFSDEVASYYFTAFIRDTDKKFTVANGAAVSSIVVGEHLIPDNPCTLGGNSIDSTRVALYWGVNSLNHALFDSVAVWYNEFGYPGKAYDSGSIKAGVWDLKTTSDTITGLKPDKLYFFSIYGLDTLGVWSRTSDSAKLQIRTGKAIGTTKGYPVIFKSSEVESFFSDTITICGKDFNTPHIDTLDRWDIPFSNGFIVCGPSFSFRNGTIPLESSLEFSVKYQLPNTLFSGNAIGVYRFNVNTLAWRLDTVTIKCDSASSRLTFSTSEPELPFALMIDTVAPYLSVYIKDTASYAISEPLCDTFTIRDNIENPQIKLLASSGAKVYTDFSYFVVPAGTGLYKTTIPAYVADPVSGLRSILIISDGHYTDTVNLSRKIVRSGINCDDKIIPSLEWTPVAVTAQPIRKALDAVFEEALSVDTFRYDSSEQRIMRWLPTVGNSSSTWKWVEYSAGTVNDFSFSPGKTIWIKSKRKMPISFNTAVIPALIDTFEIVLKKGVWNDFSLPWNFDIYARDIINATAKKDSLPNGIELNEWVKSGNTYSSRPLYLQGAEDIVGSGAVLKAGSAYIAFNSSDHDITMRIPPVCVALSETASNPQTLKKTLNSQSWSVKLGFRNGNGAELAPVYCMALQDSREPRYYQAAPTFSAVSAYVMDGKSGKQFGHAECGDLSNGGTSFLISCENRSESVAHCNAFIENTANLPAGTKTALYFDEAHFDTSAMPLCSFDIPAKKQYTGYLIIGTADYIAGSVKNLRSVFSFRPITINRSLQIRYTLPVDVQKVTTSIFDLKGRCLDKIEMPSGLHAGEGILAIDRRFVSGYYVVQMKIETVGKSKPSVLNHRWMFVR
ncbi:MAG: right-handed parallel beta-helix repeat-containing protein [Chitinispirillaceae bacterium]|nr:right-handed parallel beta-helix repeat-containing protein [Chitinispirillaceae bacterium]